MEVKIRQRSGDTANQSTLKQAAEYFLDQLCPNRTFSVTVSICKLDDHGDSVIDDNENGYIRISNTDDFLTQLTTLAHEVVHIKQYAQGQLGWTKSGKGYTWNGKRRRVGSDMDSYRKTPWEREAESCEYILVQGFIGDVLTRRHLAVQDYYATIT
jgi:hypothetical protein